MWETPFNFHINIQYPELSTFSILVTGRISVYFKHILCSVFVNSTYRWRSLENLLLTLYFVAGRTKECIRCFSILGNMYLRKRWSWKICDAKLGKTAFGLLACFACWFWCYISRKSCIQKTISFPSYTTTTYEIQVFSVVFRSVNTAIRNSYGWLGCFEILNERNGFDAMGEFTQENKNKFIFLDLRPIIQ